MREKLIIILLFCGLSTGLQAQSRWGFFAGGGTTWYYGDMNDRLLTHKKLFSHYWKAGLLYKASQRVYITGSYASAKVVGADSLAIQDFNLQRDLHFRNDIWYTSLDVEYRLLGYNDGRTRKVAPYLVGGVSYFHHNPVAILNGNEIELRQLGTEGQNIQNGGYDSPYKEYSFSFPYGIGVEFKLTNAFALRLEIVNHYTLTDYFDDLSNNYADSMELAGTPLGALAVEMASNLATGYPRKGFGRGNPKNNDTYVFAGLSLLYSPFNDKDSGKSGNKSGNHKSGKRKKRKASCPAFD
ncbi:MAG: hypothetical protein IPO63_11265 [Bacteroidetes bacterium]|nr:hypothetical protein [Bacteroidota bacterium]